MPKVALVVDECGDYKAQVIAAIRDCASVSVGEIATAIRTGMACFEVPIFGRKDPGFAQRLLKLLSKLDELGTTYAAYELLDQQQFESQSRSSYFQITKDRLTNMIFTREKSLKSLRESSPQE